MSNNLELSPMNDNLNDNLELSPMNDNLELSPLNKFMIELSRFYRDCKDLTQGVKKHLIRT